MRLSFRQGLARFQTDVMASPIFLQRSAGSGHFIDLIVSPDPTIIAFAHRSANYIVEETRTVLRAWGPIPAQTTYLYWDMNMLTGEITRGTTLLGPMYTGMTPAAPVIDQHWFDTDEAIMRVWNGVKWVEKIRVFAGYVTSGALIRPYSNGSQAGLIGDFEGGSLVLDAYQKPLRQSDGTFLTSATQMIVVNGSGKNVKFEGEVLTGMAAEPIPKFSLIRMKAGRKIELARHTDYTSRIAGIVTEDLYTNEVGTITGEGLVTNTDWNWPADKIGRPVFCGPNGEVTTDVPTYGVMQVAGYIHDSDSVFFKHQNVIILDDVTDVVLPPTPTGIPVADFFANTISGVAPLTVTFTSTSLNTPTSFNWDFTSDGTTDATTATATYTYATPGIYDVSLRAQNAYGHDDEVKIGYITVLRPPPSGLFTNLGVMLGGPNQVSRGHTFQVSISISNDGFETATQVIRKIRIADVKGQQIVPSGLPTGAVVTRELGTVTVITLPVVATLPSGTTYGPTYFNLTAPTKSGQVVMYGYVESPEVDQTTGDNSASIAVEVQ